MSLNQVEILCGKLAMIAVSHKGNERRDRAYSLSLSS